VNVEHSLLAGFAGAVALNAVHESVRQFVSEAPRVHRVAMQSLSRSMEKAGQEPPGEGALYGMALTGDLVSNSLYYSLVGWGDPQGAPKRGLVLGGVAGAGAVALPPLLGLDREPVARSASRALMTVAWYAIGGLVAGWVSRALAR
jgi:hypothetical protein